MENKSLPKSNIFVIDSRYFRGVPERTDRRRVRQGRQIYKGGQGGDQLRMSRKFQVEFVGSEVFEGLRGLVPFRRHYTRILYIKRKVGKLCLC